MHCTVLASNVDPNTHVCASQCIKLLERRRVAAAKKGMLVTSTDCCEEARHTSQCTVTTSVGRGKAHVLAQRVLFACVALTTALRLVRKRHLARPHHASLLRCHALPSRVRTLRYGNSVVD